MKATKDIFSETYSDVSPNGGCRYTDRRERRSVMLGPIALFSEHILTTSNRKELKTMKKANFVRKGNKKLTNCEISDV